MNAVRNKCKIYLTFGGNRMVLPVNPEEITSQYPTEHKTFDVIGTGQVIVPQKPSLKQVSWEGFLPALTDDPYTNSGAKRPETYIKVLERAMKNKQKGRLLITRSGSYDTNMRCLISDFRTTDKGGEPGDIYYSIELVEAKSPSVETISIVTTPAAPSVPAQVAAEPEREVEAPVLRVGASVIANGRYWNDSFGGKPFGTANNLSTTVTRIVEGNPYPVHVGHYGWLSASQLQITG